MIWESKLELVELAKQHEGINAEAGGKCGWFATADNFINFLRSPEGKRMAKKYSEDLINHIYELAKDYADNSRFKWNTCPIVISGKTQTLHIRRRYSWILDDINKNKDKFGLKHKLELHDGFGTRASNGEEYEIQLKEQIIKLVNLAEQNKGLKHYNDLINQSKEFDQCIKDMFNAGAFKGIFNVLEKNSDLNLNKIIITTGKKDTQRNKRGQIIDKNTYEINTTDLKEVLDESGNIIADLTIEPGYGEDPVYISVKMKASQLTGINVYALANEAVYKYSCGDDTISLNDDLFKPYKKFINNFGISFEDLMLKYRELESTGKCDTNIKLIPTYNKKALGIMVQKMIGGNYWYAKPSYAMFVGNKDVGFKFEVEKAYLAKNPSKSLIIDGNINGISCEFVLRTDGRDIFNKSPYRLFVKTDVKSLINKMVE
jgi:hypothetical protein